ncbi:MAG: flavodoxin family protein [Thermodesulfobacteriota bacterium]|nr:flavodoxin family protein [Thermodesulfobacteriota bacterium]
MRIIAICGSPHKRTGNTYRMLERMLEYLDNLGAQTEMINLCELEIKFCLSCAKCVTKGVCPLDDDIITVQKKMKEASGIILGSPCYVLSVSAQMKVLIDRCWPWMHSPCLQEKYGACVCPSAGIGDMETAYYMNFFLRVLGAQTVGEVCGLASLPGKFLEKDIVWKELDELAKKLYTAIKEKRRYPRANDCIQFQRGMRDLILYYKDTVFSKDYNHWKSHGWIEQTFDLDITK